MNENVTMQEAALEFLKAKKLAALRDLLAQTNPADIAEFLKVSKIRMTILLILIIVILSSSPFVIKFISDAFEKYEIGNEKLEDEYLFLEEDLIFTDDFKEYFEECSLNRKLKK